METYYPIIYMIVVFVVVVLGMLFALNVRNARTDLDTRLTGLWTNEAHTIRIILHHEDSVFQAEVVWADLKLVGKELLGFKIIKHLMHSKLQYKSMGVYVDPITEMEYPVQIYWKGKGKMKLAVMTKLNGRNEVLREEEWYRI